MRLFLTLATLAVLTAACTPTANYDSWGPSGSGGADGSVSTQGGESLQESKERSGGKNPGETGGATEGGGFGPISG